MLSAVTNIPQTVLFGRSPAGMNATGQGDLENYYNLCERIQKMMLYRNLKTLTEIVFAAAHAKGDLDTQPPPKIKFSPLWSLSETEQAAIDQTRAATSQTKAQTAQIYVDMGALDPSEVRRGLAENKEFDIEKLLDELPESDLVTAWESTEEPKNELQSDSCGDIISDGKCKAKDPEKCRVHGEGKIASIAGFKGDSGKKHIGKRQSEGYYKDLTEEQYSAAALSLLQKEIGGDIEGYETKSGKVVRWNKATNDYVVGVSGENVKTMFPLRGGQERFDKLRERDMKEETSSE